MRNNSLKISLVLLLSVLIIIPSTLALTAKIGGQTGSAKAIINAKVGEIVYRVLPVTNDNNVSVRITLTANGDFENYTIFEQNNFTLNPQETKDVNYKIGVAKEGSTRTDIYVTFTPEEGYSVGALATFQIKANETLEDFSISNLERDLQISQPAQVKSNNTTSNSTPSSASPFLIFSISTIILVLVFIFLIFSYTKNRATKPKKNVNMNA